MLFCCEFNFDPYSSTLFHGNGSVPYSKSVPNLVFLLNGIAITTKSTDNSETENGFYLTRANGAPHLNRPRVLPSNLMPLYFLYTNRYGNIQYVLSIPVICWWLCDIFARGQHRNHFNISPFSVKWVRNELKHKSKIQKRTKTDAKNSSRIERNMNYGAWRL